ncbi:hypothetical protein CRG98_016787 [Punica granatum]|nr:hypothetical protein CRG98_016787 [Punica granatum]
MPPLFLFLLLFFFFFLLWPDQPSNTPSFAFSSPLPHSIPAVFQQSTISAANIAAHRSIKDNLTNLLAPTSSPPGTSPPQIPTLPSFASPANPLPPSPRYSPSPLGPALVGSLPASISSLSELTQLFLSPGIITRPSPSELNCLFGCFFFLLSLGSRTQTHRAFPHLFPCFLPSQPPSSSSSFTMNDQSPHRHPSRSRVQGRRD